MVFDVLRFNRVVTVMAGVWLAASTGCGAPDTGMADVAAAASVRQAPIIHGRAYDVDERPSAVALMAAFPQGAIQFCTATLVAPDAAITAAHCVEAFFSAEFEGARFFVARASDLTSFVLPADAVAIADQVVHPAYDSRSSPTPDVGMVFLEAPILDVAPTAVLAATETGYLRGGQPIEAVGWGLRTPNGQDSGRKFGVATALQFVADDLLGYGIPLGDEQPNLCNGDSGGPTFLEVDGELRVIGVASRSDCRTVSLVARADAFAGFFDAEMRARCGAGARVSCDVAGLPTATELGGAPLPPPADLEAPRRIPGALEGDLRDAAEQVGQCFGLDESEGVALLATDAFALGGPGCSAGDVATGSAFLACVAAAGCGGLNGACDAEHDAMTDAARACSDVVFPPDPTEALDPPLLDAIEDLCATFVGCGFYGTVEACVADIAARLTSLTELDCPAVEALQAGQFACLADVSCAEFAQGNDDPGGCSAVATEDDFNAAFANCDDVPGPDDGDPVPPGDGGDGDGDDDGRDDDQDEDDDAPPIFDCTTTTPDGGAGALLGLVLLAVRPRRRSRSVSAPA
jgi:MYXO-CTERM domain-containing protein